MEQKKLIGLFIIGIMVASTIGLVVIDYAQNDGTGTIKYNGIKFIQTADGYTAKVNGESKHFIFFPQDIEYVQLNEQVRALLDQPVITITYDANSTLAPNYAEAQYYIELQTQNEKIIERAASVAVGELPAKTCADATPAQPVIQFEDGNSTITADGNCIRIASRDAYDAYQKTERLVYHLLKVIP